jgi:hypothetical protein
MNNTLGEDAYRRTMCALLVLAFFMSIRLGLAIGSIIVKWREAKKEEKK